MINPINLTQNIPLLQKIVILRKKAKHLKNIYKKIKLFMTKPYNLIKKIINIIQKKLQLFYFSKGEKH